MSVILYSSERFSRIYASLKAKIYERYHGDYAEIFGYSFKTNSALLKASLCRFTKDLELSNIMCWNEQYPDETQPLDIEIYPAKPYTDVELYKALQAVDYNLYTNGGTLKSVNGCEEKLKKVLELLAYEIISSLPEYAEAEW